MKPLLDDVETQKAMDQAAMLKQAPAGIHGISDVETQETAPVAPGLADLGMEMKMMVQMLLQIGCACLLLQPDDGSKVLESEQMTNTCTHGHLSLNVDKLLAACCLQWPRSATVA